MNNHRHVLIAIGFFFIALLDPLTLAQSTTNPAPLQISDIPRATQLGTGPIPPGAPGNGRYIPPLPANPALPTLWLIGDSTVRNGTVGDNGPTGQWGWGAPLPAFFDTTKINVVNRAFGGTSSRSFYNGFFWKNLEPQLKKGDIVIMQFGANDNGGAKGKGALPGISDETQMNGDETVHTFGWYLKQFVAETRAQNATPIICSLTPRKHWSADNKQFIRDNTTHAAWARQVAQQTQTPFIPLYDIIATQYESLGPEKVDALYVPSPKERLHTGWDGAIINAQCVIAGLKALPDDPLADFLSPRASAIPPASDITNAAQAPATNPIH
jgi:lysophospholipase L1-like esterase